MKFGISNIAWDVKCNDYIFKVMQENGFTGLEIAPSKICENFPEVTPQEIEKINTMMTQYGFEIPSMQALLFGTTDLYLFQNEQRRHNMMQHLQKCVDLCSEIHCENMVFGSPKNRIYSDYASDYDIAIAFFSELGDYCNLKGVTISIEANPAIYGGNFLLNTKESYDFVSRVDHQNIKMQLDLGAIIANDETIADIEQYFDKIVHVHLSRPGLKFDQRPEFDLILFQLLKRLDYQGYLSIEMLSNNVREVKNAIEYVCSIVKMDQ